MRNLRNRLQSSHREVSVSPQRYPIQNSNDRISQITYALPDAMYFFSLYTANATVVAYCSLCSSRPNACPNHLLQYCSQPGYIVPHAPCPWLPLP